MSANNPMSFYSENVDAWGPLEWFDRLAKAVHARSQAVRDKDDIAFETYKNIASSSATRLVSDFEDKVRMALTTLRELEKANIAYVDANTELLSTLESLQRENEELREKAGLHSADAKTAWAECDELRKRLDIGPHGEDAVDVAESAADHFRNRAEEAEAEVKRLREALQNVMGCYDTPLSRRRFPPDVFMTEAIITARQALASTGGEHNGN